MSIRVVRIDALVIWHTSPSAILIGLNLYQKQFFFFISIYYYPMYLSVASSYWLTNLYISYNTIHSIFYLFIITSISLIFTYIYYCPGYLLSVTSPTTHLHIWINTPPFCTSSSITVSQECVWLAVCLSRWSQQHSLHRYSVRPGPSGLTHPAVSQPRPPPGAMSQLERHAIDPRMNRSSDGTETRSLPLEMGNWFLSFYLIGTDKDDLA